MEKTLKQQIMWLIKNYRDYSHTWYQSNPARTQAIFKREYAKALTKQSEWVKKQLQQEREDKVEQWDNYALANFNKHFSDLSHSEKRALTLGVELYV